MKMLDLFSGIGGFSLAASWLGIETVAFCERDKFCQRILNKHWQGVPIESDIFTLDGTKYRGIDIITAGFPCQPFSVAGQRKGEKDERHLWPEVIRVVSEALPEYILLENVPGILTIDHGRVFEQIHADLENQGYETQCFIIPACAAGAPHRRDRIWIACHFRDTTSTGRETCDTISIRDGQRSRQFKDSDSYASKSTGAGLHTSEQGVIREDTEQAGQGDAPEVGRLGILDRGQVVTDTDNTTPTRYGEDSSGIYGEPESEGLDIQHSSITNCYAPDTGSIPERHTVRTGISETCERTTGHNRQEWCEPWFEVATRFCRVDDGVSNRVDRLKALGNSIVPPIAYQVLKAMIRDKH